MFGSDTRACHGIVALLSPGRSPRKKAANPVADEPNLLQLSFPNVSTRLPGDRVSGVTTPGEFAKAVQSRGQLSSGKTGRDLHCWGSISPQTGRARAGKLGKLENFTCFNFEVSTSFDFKSSTWTGLFSSTRPLRDFQGHTFSD